MRCDPQRSDSSSHFFGADRRPISWLLDQVASGLYSLVNTRNHLPHPHRAQCRDSLAILAMFQRSRHYCIIFPSHSHLKEDWSFRNRNFHCGSINWIQAYDLLIFSYYVWSNLIDPRFAFWLLFIRCLCKNIILVIHQFLLRISWKKTFLGEFPRWKRCSC